MRVTFFLTSIALHIAVLTAPIPHTKKTSEHLLPVTLVLQPIKQETKTPSVAQPRRKRVEKSAPRHLRQARGENVKTAGKARTKIAAPGKKPLKQEAIPASTEDIVDHPPEPPRFAHSPLGVLQPVPTTSKNGPQLYAEEVGEKKERAIDEQLSSRDIRKAAAPEPSFLRAKYSYAPKPEYPEQARREGWQGTVLLAILVDAEGRPEKIVLNRSSGFTSLDTAAEEIVKIWRFQPARYGSQQVESWVKVPIVFTLTEAKN